MRRKSAETRQQIIDALWADVEGAGPDSGMWWHDNLEQVCELSDLDAGDPNNGSINCEADLYQLLGAPSIFVQETGYGYPHPCAVICLEAPFEIEHGIGLLTDGEKILGTGYSMDVSPFED